MEPILLIKYFSNVYNASSNLCLTTQSKVFSSTDQINLIEIKQMDVFNELRNIDFFTFIDGTLAKFLKECSFVLTPMITLLFNKSLNSGLYPDKWKLAFISPIFKKGNKNDVSIITGPITKMSIIPKIFLKLVNKAIMPLCKQMLITKQHVFRNGRSTLTNVCIFKQYKVDSFKHKVQTDVIYTDIEKSFDRLNHSLLI